MPCLYTHGGKVGNGRVHGQKPRFQPIRAEGVHFLQRQGVFQREHAGARALERSHMAAAAQIRADVVTERANVDALAAVHFQTVAAVAQRGGEAHVVHAAGARGHFHALAAPRQLVQPLAAALDGRVHGRPLPYLADEAGQRGAHVRLGDVHAPRLHHRAGGVLRVGDDAQLQFGHVGLLLVDDVVKQPRGRAHAHGQNARGHGVERAAVADGRAARQALAHEHHTVAGRFAQRLVQHEEAVHQTTSRTRDSTTSTASASGRWMVMPAARSWPPPPRGWATSRATL